MHTTIFVQSPVVFIKENSTLEPSAIFSLCGSTILQVKLQRALSALLEYSVTTVWHPITNQIWGSATHRDYV